MHFLPMEITANDYLWFYGLENSESNELTVFNRQGNVVFRARNYQVNPDVDLWNGLDFSGNPVRDDTYFFTLTVNNDVPFQGFIILKR
jgi:gliding motility-associated-like protein